MEKGGGAGKNQTGLIALASIILLLIQELLTHAFIGPAINLVQT
jgi:hypothetical protein